MTDLSFKRLMAALFQLVCWGVYRAYQAEGINALFLVMPAKLIPGILARHGAVMGSGVQLHSPLIIHNARADAGMHYRNLRIGARCYLGRDVFLDLADRISLADRVTVSMRVTILTHTHVGASPLAIDFPPIYRPVTLREGCYVGAGATLLPGVEIGIQAVVGAGAVVTRDVPDRTVVAGVPARVIRKL